MGIATLQKLANNLIATDNKFIDFKVLAPEPVSLGTNRLRFAFQYSKIFDTMIKKKYNKDSKVTIKVVIERSHK